LNRPPRESLRDVDAELMARAADGDRAAWRELYVRHRDHVFRVAFRFLGNEASARDVTQEVFIALFTRAKAYRHVAAFTAYLRRLTVNRCINTRASAHEAHRSTTAEAVLFQVPDAHPDPESSLDQRQTTEGVRAAVAMLPARQRMAVILSRFEGMSYEEIASALDCSISSVESLLFRARQALARTLSGL
jgi:RNA polymerase sigma-70 factor, ECF subfamily